MKRALCLLLICLFCTGCSALPPEERAFCVVLLVDGGAQECTVRVRIPTYQQNGGYQTLSATGATLTDAAPNARIRRANAPCTGGSCV